MTDLWKQRFDAPKITTAQIAAKNHERGMVVMQTGDTSHLHAWNVATGDLRRIAATDFGGISPDGATLYYFDGTHLVSEAFDGDGTRRELTSGFTPYTPISMSASLNGTSIGFTVATSQGFRIYTHDDSPRLLYQSPRPAFGPLLSHDADFAVITVTDRQQYHETSLLAFHMTGDDRQTVRVLEEDDGMIRPVEFAPLAGDSRLLAMTDLTGVVRPLVWNVATGDRIDLPLEDIDGDLTPVSWDGNRILMTCVNRAHHHLYVYDLERSTFDQVNTPPGTIDSAYFSGDEIIALHQDSTTAPQVIALSPQRRTVLASNAPPAPAWRSVQFTSSGGVEIQAWLATPAGDPPFPAVIHAHGGPDDVMTECYHPEAAAWVDHGFVWLSVNYRGSTTFGREFQAAIYGMLGLREVDDLAAGSQWLVEQGLATEGKIVLTGAHYGGFLALLALGRRPDPWAGAVVEAPITDWQAFYDSGTEVVKAYVRAIFDGTPDELPAQYRNSSPVSYTIDAPVLYIRDEDMQFRIDSAKGWINHGTDIRRR